MTIREKIVKTTDRVTVDTIVWKDRKPRDTDYNDALIWLNKQRLYSDVVRGYENDSEKQSRIENVANWIAQRKRMALWGITDKPIVVSGSSMHVRSSVVRGFYEWPDSFMHINPDQTQNLANGLTETTEGSRVFTRFNGHSNLGDSGSITPCLTARSIGTIEEVDDGVLKIREIPLPHDQEILFETRGLVMSPLSQVAKLGKQALRIG